MIRIHLSPHRGIQSIACLIALVAPTVHGAPQGRVSAQAAWATQSAPAVPDSPDQNPGKEPDEPAKTPAPPARQGPPLAPLAKNRKPDPQALRDAERTGEVTVSVRFTEMRAADTPPSRAARPPDVRARVPRLRRRAAA